MTAQSEWGAALAAEVGQRVQRYRRARGMTAAQLSERMTEVGAPMTRSILANLENGRRPSVSLAEMLAFAYLLDVPLVALILDYGSGESTVTLIPEAGPTPMEQAVAWLRNGNVRTEDGRALAVWVDAAYQTRQYGAHVTEGKVPSPEFLRLVRLARERARLMGVTPPPPPINTPEVDDLPGEDLTNLYGGL